MTNTVVNIQNYRNNLAEKFFAACLVILDKEDRPSLEKLKEAK